MSGAPGGEDAGILIPSASGIRIGALDYLSVGNITPIEVDGICCKDVVLKS